MEWAVKGPVRVVGRIGAGMAGHAGGMGLLAWRAVVAVVSGKVSFRACVHQLFSMGVQSRQRARVTAVLSGFVTAQQGGYQFTGSVPLYVLGSIVTTSVILELGPVLTAVVVIGRVGARITAELGTMQVSEQIDAL